MKSKRKILILGGTEFVGRQLVEKLSLLATDEIYLFNRGKTNPDLFPNIHRIIGDRETDDIQKISQHQWDYVVDFSAYFPKSLERTLQYINQDVKGYIFISTISVYPFSSYDGSFKIAEDFQKKEYKSDQLTAPGLKFYGEKKSACEDVLRGKTWLNSMILRPCIIYGKYDPTDRFYYWIERIKKQKKIILPGNGANQLSLTYSGDLVNIIIGGLSGNLSKGIYNCVSDHPLKIRTWCEKIREVLKSNCEFIPIESQKLKEEEFTGHDFPFWFKIDLMFDNAKLKKELNIEFCNLDESLQSTIDYYENQGWQKPKIGITFEKENELIEKIGTYL